MLSRVDCLRCAHQSSCCRAYANQAWKFTEGLSTLPLIYSSSVYLCGSTTLETLEVQFQMCLPSTFYLYSAPVFVNFVFFHALTPESCARVRVLSCLQCWSSTVMLQSQWQQRQWRLKASLSTLNLLYVEFGITHQHRSIKKGQCRSVKYISEVSL